MVIPCSRVSHTQLMLPRKSIFQDRHQDPGAVERLGQGQARLRQWETRGRWGKEQPKQ